MRFTKTVPYKLKHLVPMLGLAGATMFTACDKKNEPVINPPHNNVKDTTTVIQPKAHYNVELFFNAANYENFEYDTIRKYDADQYVDTIFMIPDGKAGIYGGFTGMTTDLLTLYRDYFQARFNTSSKMRGKGELLFDRGALLPADSLWFVQQGWTVNQSRNNQR